MQRGAPKTLDWAAVAAAAGTQRSRVLRERDVLTHPERRAVIWLVAPSFDQSLSEEWSTSPIRLWRRAGVDARLLELEVRLPPGTSGTYIRVRREDDAPRRELTDDVLRQLEQRGASPRHDQRLAMQYYDECSPSCTSLAHGGGMLERGCAALVESVPIGNGDLRKDSNLQLYGAATRCSHKKKGGPASLWTGRMSE